MHYEDRLAPNSSSDLPFVSGITFQTQINCKIIIKVKMAKTVAAPMVENKKGMADGIAAANTQCTEHPNDCPSALR